ncbi:MAG: Ig-like domain-containing protein [Bacteroidales bacterium]|nr:Ig-like domain-containing protein [Bacteroidales bacterium]
MKAGKIFSTVLWLLTGGVVAVAEEAPQTATWSLDQGDANATAAVVSQEGILSATGFTMGDKLYIPATSATVKAGDETMTKFQPTEKLTTKDESAYIQFYLTPKKGVTLTPKTMKIKATKIGTNGGTIDIVAKAGDKTVTLVESLAPYRTNDKDDTTPEYSDETLDMSGVGSTAERLTVYVYVYNLNSDKQIGISDIEIAMAVEGEAQEVARYTLSVGGNMEEAGKVTANPSGAEFDEGTEVTVTAGENFGYHFQKWVDSEGATASEENPYTFQIEKNTSLTAQYSKSEVYSVVVELEGGANYNLVQYNPVGNVVDGVHYYEEGTDVRLTAVSNRILTFTSWEDNSTNIERDIRVTGDMTLRATFASEDYIVGWDLYDDQPSKDRAADYKSDSENAGMLSLRNAEGQTTSWLTRGVNNGKENGRYGARVWKALSEGWYFEITFSSKGYKNLVLSAGVDDDYNAYAKTDVQYSVDGENYTTFGTYELPYRGWAMNEFALPEAANDQEKVWIRFYGQGFMTDGAEMQGVESTNDGTTVGEIFVLGEPEAANDEVAPSLVTILPADGSEGVGASGSVVLTFDEKVKAGEGQATLNGQAIEATISGRTVVYRYAGLEYDTEYEFVVGAGVLTDRSGNAYEGTTVRFRTMKREEPEMKVVDAIVAQDGSGDYTTVQAAIDAAPTGRVKPWMILVKNGVYQEHIDVPANKPYISLIGQDRDKTIIADDKLCGGDNALHVSVGATVVVKADDFYAENITFENSYGHEKQAGPQALALNTMGDRVVLNNVSLLSYQDTWITTSTSNNRHYAKNCLIEGAVDFIYNSGNVYFDGDTLEINRPSGGYIVAPSHSTDVEWGYVFVNNVIRARKGVNVTDIWLGRPWHNNPLTVFINTRTYVGIPAAGWYETMGGLPAIWADYNTTDADGNPLDLSMRRDTYYKTVDGEKVYGKAKNSLTAEEVATYTIRNVVGGKDSWMPDLLTEAPGVPEVSEENGWITWEPVEYATCYIVEADGEIAAVTTESKYAIGGNKTAKYTVRSVGEYGALSQRAVVGASAVTSVKETGCGASVRRKVYDMSGRRNVGSRRGVNIVVETDADGRSKVEKVVVR